MLKNINSFAEAGNDIEGVRQLHGLGGPPIPNDSCRQQRGISSTSAGWDVALLNCGSVIHFFSKESAYDK